MPTKKKRNGTKMADSNTTLHLVDTVRLPLMRKIFEQRGYPGMSLSAMGRIALDEWIKDNNGK